MKKQELRKIYLEKRLQLTATEYETLNQQLLQQFEQLDFSAVNTIHLFLPMLRTKEPNTWPLIHFLQKTYPNIKRVFPKADFKTKTLTHYLDEADLIIAENKFGIPEPISGHEIYIGKNSIVIVPLLAFDLQGNRVGYGGGFYDRFLTECETGTQFIGLSFFEPVDLIDNVDGLDVKLHGCITPSRFCHFGGRKNLL